MSTSYLTSSTHNQLTGRSPLIINQSDVIHVIPVIEILFCKADRSYFLIHLVNGNVITHSKNLSNLYKLLEDCFIKISKSVIVNKGHIRKIDKKTKTLTLSNNHELTFTTKHFIICNRLQEGCWQSKMGLMQDKTIAQ
jgi:DNA-binding LytR/AlgR family response regulator